MLINCRHDYEYVQINYLLQTICPHKVRITTTIFVRCAILHVQHEYIADVFTIRVKLWEIRMRKNDIICTTSASMRLRNKLLLRRVSPTAVSFSKSTVSVRKAYRFLLFHPIRFDFCVHLFPLLAEGKTSIYTYGYCPSHERTVETKNI